MRKPSRTAGYAVLASGVLLAAGGAAFVAMYVYGAVIGRLGEPDQSLLFWYLPLLFLGIGGLGIGAGLAVWGSRLLRRSTAR